MSGQKPRIRRGWLRDLLMQGPSWDNELSSTATPGLALSQPPSQQVAQNDNRSPESPNSRVEDTARSARRLDTTWTPAQAPQSHPSGSTFDSDPSILNGGTINSTIRGNVVTGPVYGTVTMKFNESTKLIEQLKASLKADYRYYPDGDETASLHSCCCPGTRKSILQVIIEWAIRLSSDSAAIFWLAGPAGTGKSTIANTICHALDSVIVGDKGGRTMLGGTFFCSRQFPETRNPVWIVRTIVYQLALKSPAFKAALLECGRLETVDHGPRSQLITLLVGPWKASTFERLANYEPIYVVSIDALDELDREKGSEFLRTLLEVVKEHELSGLKFLVTSRLHPAMINHVESFHNKQVCRLEQVSLEETSADIKLFLDDNLGKFATKEQIQQFVSDAAGLFIYAATVVEYVKGRNREEQRSLLGRLLAGSPSPAHRPPRGATTTLDNLYTQILDAFLVDARDRNDPDAFQDSLSILHTFLCTIERTSTSVAVAILNETRDEGQGILYNGDANGIVHRLHAVLHIERGQVMWFHKSFPDFIFDKTRSQKFFCDQDQLHCRLTKGCFQVMNKHLRFNIANIPSSYQLDCDNSTLASSINNKISGTLRYACGSWTCHLALTPREKSDDLLVCLYDFLQLQFLFWIEVMNLLGDRGRCQGMMRDARDWVAKAKEPVGWASELADAAAFTTYHNTSGATSSTPHLYISSLATFPRHSTLLHKWKHHFKGIPEFVNAPGAAGQALISSFVAESEVKAVAVAPNGTTIAIGASSSIRMWDVSTGEVVKTLKGHTDMVQSVAFSPDGTQVVSGSRDMSVRVWDSLTGEEVKSYEGHFSSVTSVAFSPMGTQVVSGSDDESVRVWDLSTGKVKIFEDYTDSITSVAFSPDGKQIVSASYQSIRIWDLSTGKEVKAFEGHTDTVASVTFSPDGTQVVSGSYDRSIRVWDLSTGEQLKTFKDHMHMATSVALSPDGTQIASGSYNSVRVWDVSTGEEVNRFEGLTDRVNSVAFFPDGTHVVSGSENKSVRIWDLLTKTEANSFESYTSVVSSVAFSTDGTRAVSCSYNKLIRVWDMSTGKEVNTFKGHTGEVTSVAFSPDDTQVVSGSYDTSVRVWDLSTGEQLKIFKDHINVVISVAFSPDGSRIISVSFNNYIRIWDVSTEEEVMKFRGHTRWVDSVAFSSDGTRIVSASLEGSVQVWDLLTGKEVLTFEGHTEFFKSVAFSPDTTHIVLGLGDNSVRVWDLSTGKEVRSFEGHTGDVGSVAFSPGGTQVVSGSHDGSVRVWDVLTGKQAKFEGHTGIVSSVAFSPNGSMVISGSADGSLRLWDCSTEQAPLRFVRQKNLVGENTGWLLSPSNFSQYLMFVPLLGGLTDDSNVLTIPARSAPKLDLSRAKLGDRWAECYTPKSL